MKTASQRTGKHHRNSKGHGPAQQGPGATKVVHACGHAWDQGRARRSPAPIAVTAVKRNEERLRALCPKNGNRAALDYSGGIAIVERKSARRLEVVTILEVWMSTKNTPVIVDGVRTPAVNHTLIQRQQAAEAKIKAAVEAHRAAKTEEAA